LIKDKHFEMSSYKDFQLRVKAGEKTLTFTQFKNEHRLIKTNKEKQNTNSELPAPTLKPSVLKPFVDNVERPAKQDYETGFDSRVSVTSIDEKFPGYHQGSIEDYLKRLSQKMNNEYSWWIACTADRLNIYDQSDKLFKTVPLYHVSGDSYYAVFNETGNEFVKAHKAIAFVNWFL
jgi:hypothetical protein